MSSKDITLLVAGPVEADEELDCDLVVRPVEADEEVDRDLAVGRVEADEELDRDLETPVTEATVVVAVVGTGLASLVAAIIISLVEILNSRL